MTRASAIIQIELLKQDLESLKKYNDTLSNLIKDITSQREKLQKELNLTKLELIHAQQTIRTQQYCMNKLHEFVQISQRNRVEDFLAGKDILKVGS